MRVKTSVIMDKPPAAVWPLLCSSKMDPRMPCFFRLGIPKPVECRLPDGTGGVGARRECISNSGVIQQRITDWQERRRLRFRMEDTTLHFRPCVTEMTDEFVMEPIGSAGTKLTRTTDIHVSGKWKWIKGAIMCLGMKCVHRYVFKNWARTGA